MIFLIASGEKQQQQKKTFAIPDLHWTKFATEWDGFKIAKLSLQQTVGSKLST